MTDPCRSAALERAAEAIVALDASEGVDRDVSEDVERDAVRSWAHATLHEHFLKDAGASPVMASSTGDCAADLDKWVKAAQEGRVTAPEKAAAPKKVAAAEKQSARADPACDGWQSAVWFDDSHMDAVVAAARDSDWLPLAQRPRRGLREILADAWGGPHGRLVFERSLYQARFEKGDGPIDEAGARRLVALLAEAWRQGFLVPNCAMETSLERIDARAYDAALHVKRLDAVIARAVERDHPAPLALADWPARSRNALLAPRRIRRDGEKPDAPRRPRLNATAHVERDALIVVALAALAACGLPPQRNPASHGVPFGADIVASELTAVATAWDLRPDAAERVLLRLTPAAVEKVWLRRPGRFALSLART